jgi:2-hydroxychromene-2-carboxylate isomerase
MRRDGRGITTFHFHRMEACWRPLKQGQLDKTLFSRFGVAAKEMGIFEQVNDALLEAVWAGADDLTTDKGRSSFLASRSIRSDLWEIAASPEIAHQLAANDQNAAERGVFGIPTFFVDGEMFFGNDRLHFVRTHLEAANKVSGK